MAAAKKPAPEAPEELKVGSVWEFESKERVEITRPDGWTVLVDPVDGKVQHVLAQRGEYVSGKRTVEAL